MNLIDYNQAMEALEKERQYLLNREQYEAENVLVHHAVNVIAELKIVRQPEVVRCKDCVNWTKEEDRCFEIGMCRVHERRFVGDWFCADGERKENDGR